MKPPPRITLTVLAAGTNGSPKSLLIDTGVTRYLVNCGEGTQRILTEHRSKAGRIQHVLFTQMSWDYASGLLGVALTAKTAGVKKLTVHGPPNMEKLMQLTRHFADCETTDIVKSDILTTPFVDPAFRIHAIPVTSEHSVSDVLSHKRAKLEAPNDPFSYLYYFQTKQQRRKLNIEQCLALGMPKSVLNSSLIGSLLDGNEITLPNGTVITSNQVTIPAPPTPNFLIIDCPRSDVIPALSTQVKNVQALRDSSDDSGDDTLLPGFSIVIHIVPQNLFDTPAYQAFVTELDKLANETLPIHGSMTNDDCPIVQHLVLDGSINLPAISGIYSQSTILHHFFDSQVYPRLHNIVSGRWKKTTEQTHSSALTPLSRIFRTYPQLQYLVRPWSRFVCPEMLNLEEENLLADAFDPLYVDRSEAEIEFATMRQTLSSASSVSENCDREKDLDGRENLKRIKRLAMDKYPELTFLGTGSSAPNKYRNISCILLKLSPDDYIMLDCGEGTLNQLYALYGSDGTNDVLRKLRLILVTHMHADHHGGIFSIALARSCLLNSDVSDNQPCRDLLSILAPPAFARWMSSFSELFDYHPTVRLYVLPNVYMSPEQSSDRPVWLPNWQIDETTAWLHVLNRLKIQVEPVKVPHTGTSWAYLIHGTRWNVGTTFVSESPSGISPSSNEDTWSIVYSGDTPYSSDLVQAGQNCDLLIHEATMIDEHHDLAIRSRHSTLGDAIRAGRDMNAGFTLLNHFSQRYGRAPILDSFRPNVAVTFDFMTVNFADLIRLPYYLPYYKFAFAKHYDAQQTKAEAYAWRKFREETASKGLREEVA